MPLPQRTITHIHDTQAVRKVIENLKDSWLVRNMEERDYGIDLLLELFEEADGKIQNPTGKFLLFQIKGRDEKWNCQTLYHFPKKTVEYAKLFNIPFFVVFVTLKDSKVHFVHLQKYAKETDEMKSAGEEINIKIPDENDLASALGKEKIEDIADIYAKEHDIYLIQKKYFELKAHWKTIDGYDRESLLKETKELLMLLGKEEYIKLTDDFNKFCDDENRDNSWPNFNGIREMCELNPTELEENDWNCLKLFVKKIPDIIWACDGAETDFLNSKYSIPY